MPAGRSLIKRMGSTDLSQLPTALVLGQRRILIPMDLSLSEQSASNFILCVSVPRLCGAASGDA